MPRGRKKADGVLKQIDPQDREGTSRKLYYGSTADNPIANTVRWGVFLADNSAKCAAQVGDVWTRTKEHADKLLREHEEKFSREAVEALATHKAEWFRKVAEAIESVERLKGQPLYPLYESLHHLAGLYDTLDPKDGTPWFTLNEVCELLEKHFPKQVWKADDKWDPDWQRIVRRACAVVGFPLARNKPGPKPSKR
jgi:hypothetical protein